MAADQNGTLVDLEKELVCSICTDILFQPLTLLDCLHTFCGACLKEWFAWQGSNATNEHPYTCPSCRASVRDTRPNATVTSLLDLYLQSNPTRGKNEEEKNEQREIYRPGDNVLPKIQLIQDSDDEDDRRLLDEVRELSLQEVGVSGPSRREGASGSGSRLQVESSSIRSSSRDRRRRERSRESRHRDGQQRRTRESSSTRTDTSERDRPSTHQYTPPAQLEHQSSLRSLLSTSEIDSQEMEEEIMRQIVEEGLLDGIDLSNITVIQEDEISERIAQAYRRRMREKQRERQARIAARQTTSNSPIQPAMREDEQPRRRQQSAENTSVQFQSNRPPVSRPHLIESANNGHRQPHRRSSSQGSTRSTSHTEGPRRPSGGTSRPAARSALDLPTDRQLEYPAANSRRRRMSQNDRSSTDPEGQVLREQLRSGISGPSTQSNPSSPRLGSFPRDEDTPNLSATTQSRSRRTTDPLAPRHNRHDRSGSTSLIPPQRSESPQTVLEQRRPNSSSGPSRSTPCYKEPSISCKKCNKQHIEYELHYNCPKCENGNFNICLSCYRVGKGCLHWFGFGYAAWRKYQSQAPEGGYPANHPLPHTLTGHRYIKPKQPPQASSPDQALITEEDPSRRLQIGVFCEICFTFTNTCYWKCDSCNEGAWGFCNNCVNQGKHCTHPLIPLTRTAANGSELPQAQPDNSSAGYSPISSSSHQSSITPPRTPKSASILASHATPALLANIPFRPLTFTTACDICHYPITPSRTRFHCQRCNNGDYDICTSCYHSLVSSGRIGPENGHNGWRRCLQGHRMVIIGFEDRYRVITNDLVGGLRSSEEIDGPKPSAPISNHRPLSPDGQQRPQNWSWRDTNGRIHEARMPQHQSTATTTAAAVLPVGPSANFSNGLSPGRFPPEGGIGWRVQALWSYYPAEDVEDELMFPKNAEIREAFDINGDWFWGVYAGSMGLFPGNYGRIIRG